MKNNISILMSLTLLIITGCAAPTLQLAMMPRNSGTVYKGVAMPNGSGGGSITITIGERSYTGPMARTATNDSFGFFQKYGTGRSPSLAVSAISSGNNQGKAILSTVDNFGLRCDLQGDGQGHGSLICVDDEGKIYDGVVGF